MGFFDKLFGSTEEKTVQPDITFGRYTDAFKSKDQNKKWEEALSKFNKGNYLESFEAYMIYLKDPKEDNIQYKIERGTLTFTAFQGSKTLSGIADNKWFKVEAKMAKANDLHIGFLRSLMELNYDMTYARYCMDDDQNLTMVFDSSIIDASPFKLYFAMKELALHVDRQDDLLLAEFDELEPISNQHVQPLPEAELAIKLSYLRTEIQTVMEWIESGKLNEESYPGGLSYVLLNLVYKLDYFLQPQGRITEIFEKSHSIFFTKDEGLETIQKNNLIRKEIKSILDFSDQVIIKQFQRTIYTFGLTTPVNHVQLVQFIEAEIDNMNWYRDNEYEEVAIAVPGYIVGYCLFNYAMPEPDRELLHLYYTILEPAFFKALGFEYNFLEPQGAMNGKEIQKAITDILQAYQSKYTSSKPNLDMLIFNNPVDFARSFLLMLKSFTLEPTY